jgi:hypothetical protein
MPLFFPGFLPAHPALRETFTAIMVTIDGQLAGSNDGRRDEHHNPGEI